MPRFFEKISYDQFCKDICSDKGLYDYFKLPKRSTKYSAGYDFEALFRFVLKPKEVKKIPLGIKVCMNPEEVFMIFVRSSQGFKYNVRMCNQVGIIDCDYYNNKENEGHIWIKLENHGEKDYVVEQGDKICQGIFFNYLLVDNEEKIENLRTSGLGSTNEKGD